MGRIPEHVLEEVLSRVDIVELISGAIPLKKTGRNFKACCPFHHEKTPSFVVSPEKQIYHCFGCGESGNAIRFLMRHERMEFLEALKYLAGKAGVSIPQAEPEQTHKEHLSTKLYDVNELAASYYQRNLSSAAAAPVREYLKKRGILEETVKAFRIGYAPDAWDGLILYARQKGVSLSLLEKAGVILPKQGGGYYDRFRNRVIFPIGDIRGRIVAFGARVLDNSQPKYLNSPESYIYTKGKQLYGLAVAKEQIRDTDTAVIVEGYLDCMMPYQAGVRNIVASLGTALTLEQVRLLKRYTRRVVVIYDADTAGELASLRSLDIFADEEVDARIVSLPHGYDPDSFVRERGAEALRGCIEKADTIFAYKLRLLKTRYSLDEPEGKAKICSFMLETIGRIKHEVLKSEYIRRLSSELNVREESLLLELQKAKPRESGPRMPEDQARQAQRPSRPTEQLLVKMMMEEADLIHWVRQHLEPGDFTDEKIASIVKLMFELAAQGRPIIPSVLLSYVQEDELSRILCESVFLPSDASYQHKERVVNDCIQRLKAEKTKNMRKELQQRIQSAQNAGDEAAVQRLVEEFHCLIKEKV